jgi:F-type H+-transporting ATPase subunit delta
MAELATIARPYAEALFRSASANNHAAVAEQLDVLAQVADNSDLRQIAGSPKVNAEQVFELVVAASTLQLRPRVANLLRVVIENGRLTAFAEIARQFRVLLNTQSGVFDAVITSAFALDASQLADTVATLEKRFGRKLNATVVIDESLIGGIRVVVGDEVLDASVKARLERMKVALID